MMSFLFFIIIVLIFVTSENIVAELPTFILLCIGFSLVWIYLFRYYDVVTEKKIKRAIQEKDQMIWEINHPTYDCKAIKIVMERSVGKCYMCQDSDVILFLCDIKRKNKSTSVIPICNDCIDRFKANIQ